MERAKGDVIRSARDKEVGLDVQFLAQRFEVIESLNDLRKLLAVVDRAVVLGMGHSYYGKAWLFLLSDCQEVSL